MHFLYSLFSSSFQIKVVIDKKQSFKKTPRVKTEVPKLHKDQWFRSSASDLSYIFEKKAWQILLKRRLRFFDFQSFDEMGANRHVACVTEKSIKSLLPANVELQLLLHVHVSLWDLSEVHDNLRSIRDLPISS